MRIYIGHQEAVTADEFEELALGVDLSVSDELGHLFFSEAPEDDFRDLFLGRPGETDEQRRTRELAAKDVLADLLAAGRGDEIERLNAMYAVQLVCVASLRSHLGGPRMQGMQKAA